MRRNAFDALLGLLASITMAVSAEDISRENLPITLKFGADHLFPQARRQCQTWWRSTGRAEPLSGRRTYLAMPALSDGVE
jgi:hypothetical protein